MNENEGHKYDDLIPSYSVCCVRDAIMLSYFHRFSVQPAETGNGAGFEKVRMGENDSNTLREYAYFFFSKTEKKKKVRTRPQSNEDEPSGS